VTVVFPEPELMGVPISTHVGRPLMVSVTLHSHPGAVVIDTVVLPPAAATLLKADGLIA